MIKEEYIKIVDDKMKDNNSKNIMIKQINEYYNILDEYKPSKSNYKIGDSVYLKKGTLLHGTYKNFEGLKEIATNGLISSWFIDSRVSKYPSSVGVWNLKKDYSLKDYINFYSGGTIKYFNQHDDKKETEVIPYDEMNSFIDKIISKDYLVWNMEQTKEARFLPSLVQNKVQVGIIFNADNEFAHKILKGDILDPNMINDTDVKEFVNDAYYDRFIIDRRNKDDFFTDRESAILFGIPACFIEGILVGRVYEKDKDMLNKIKDYFPNSYMCNLDGIVIK